MKKHPSIEIAIVGSGPSGFFAAEALLKSGTGAQVHMFERLPTPYGLVRSGVAPDHQHIKQVVGVFEAIARNPSFSFFGNVEIGKDVTLTALRARYDAVVLAYGAASSVVLDIPGAQLPQSLTAAQFVGWYNGHPDFADVAVTFDDESAVIVGNGNVAIDIARILLSDHDRLSKTDIADHALEALRQSRIRKVHLVGRRGPAHASFTTAELRELVLGMPGVQVSINERDLKRATDDLTSAEGPVNAAVQRSVQVLKEAASQVHASTQPRELHLIFLASPVAMRGEDRVRAVEFARNELTGSGEGQQVRPMREVHSVPAGLVISSIGFRGQPLADLPFDHHRCIVPNASGRVVGLPVDGAAAVYVTGWIKRGPRGVIGTNRADARETIQSLLEDLRDGRRSERANLALTCNRVDFAGWRRIDQAETEAGAEKGRPRRKLVSVDAMLKVARPRADRAEAGRSELATGEVRVVGSAVADVDG